MRQSGDGHLRRGSVEAVTYVLNGLPPKPGAPFADPCIKLQPQRRRRPANLRPAATGGATSSSTPPFNKEGWHFPQQRMISLWGDVQ